MKLSARNVFKGKVLEIKRGQTTGHDRCHGYRRGDNDSASHIEFDDELKLKPGDAAYAVIKASDVLVGID